MTYTELLQQDMASKTLESPFSTEYKIANRNEHDWRTCHQKAVDMRKEYGGSYIYELTKGRGNLPFGEEQDV